MRSGSLQSFHCCTSYRSSTTWSLSTNCFLNRQNCFLVFLRSVRCHLGVHRFANRTRPCHCLCSHRSYHCVCYPFHLFRPCVLRHGCSFLHRNRCDGVPTSTLDNTHSCHSSRDSTNHDSTMESTSHHTMSNTTDHTSRTTGRTIPTVHTNREDSPSSHGRCSTTDPSSSRRSGSCGGCRSNRSYCRTPSPRAHSPAASLRH